MRRSWLFSYPSSATFELTNYCNLRCPVCDQQQVSSRKFGIMSYENYVKIIDEIGPFLKNLGYSDTGEAFINKDIYKIISYTAKKFGDINTYMDTNGHFIDPEKLVMSGLGKISFSIDGLTQETYEAYRKKGTLKTVLANLEELIYYKKKMNSNLFIEIKFIVMKHNQHEIDRLINYGNSIGIDNIRLETFTARAFEGKKYSEYNTLEMAKKYMSDIKQYAIYDIDKSDQHKILHSFRVQNKQACYVPWSETEILYNGDVRPCVVDFDSEHSFGNIFESKSFFSVWNSAAAIKFRKTHISEKFRYQYESCATCMITNYSDCAEARPRLNIKSTHKIISINAIK